MKILIIGGHLAPALCVIQELPKDAEILYVGRKYTLEGDKAVSLEYKTISSRGIAFTELKTGRLQRSITLHTIPSLGKIPYGFLQAVKIINKFKPDVIAGFGGYLSLPVIAAGYFLKVPIVIHEQTLDVGLANKYGARFAKKVCISFESSRKYFPKEKVVLTGNPVKKNESKIIRRIKLPGGKPVIYITGGSQGSHFINLLVLGSLSGLLGKYILVHQTGGAMKFKDFEKLSLLKGSLNAEKSNNYIISKFFEPMETESIMVQADLVVSRAGMNTVAELAVLKKPSLLIPIPVSSNNEQFKNALFLKKLGLGEVEEQKNLNPESFLITINHMFKNIDKYKLHKPLEAFNYDSAKKIVDVIYASAKNNN